MKTSFHATWRKLPEIMEAQNMKLWNARAGSIRHRHPFLVTGNFLDSFAYILENNQA